MKDLRIGLIGCGTVGTGLVQWIHKNSSIISKRCQLNFIIEKIVVNDLTKERDLGLSSSILSTDIDSVLRNDSVDIVVELMGGTSPAKEYVLQALNLGKPVVTANKALLAHSGHELFEAARKGKTDIYYEASVGGGITIIKSLREGLSGNHIQKIYGILNGTCNYILSRMEEDGLTFSHALAEAKKRGYAESDPTLDINGMDTAHKSCILASLAYGTWFDLSAAYIEGIENLDLCDLRNAAEMGYKIKLLGILKLNDGKLQMRVHPTLIPATSMLSKVDNVYNAVCVCGDMVGETMFYGQGAGASATASSIIADLIDVGLNLKFTSSHRIPAFPSYDSNIQVLNIENIYSRYYLRLSVDDKPDVLASITHALGEAGISLASVYQKESNSNKLPIVLMTHLTKESDIRQVLKKIAKLPVVSEKPVLIRIEDI